LARLAHYAHAYISTLSLHDSLPIFLADWGGDEDLPPGAVASSGSASAVGQAAAAAGGGRAGGASSSVSRSQERRKDWQRRLNEGDRKSTRLNCSHQII